MKNNIRLIVLVALAILFLFTTFIAETNSLLGVLSDEIQLLFFESDPIIKVDTDIYIFSFLISIISGFFLLLLFSVNFIAYLYNRNIIKNLFVIAFIFILNFSFIIYFSLYMVIHRMNQSNVDYQLYNKNIPLLMYNSSEYGLTDKDKLLLSTQTLNGFFIKRKGFYDNLTGEILTPNERYFLSMLDGTYLSYYSFIEITDMSTWSESDLAWLYSLHFTSFESLYDKLEHNKKTEFYKKRIEKDRFYFNKINIELQSYNETKLECSFEAKDNVSAFCYSNKWSDGKAASIERLKFLKSKMDSNRNNYVDNYKKMNFFKIIKYYRSL